MILTSNLCGRDGRPAGDSEEDDELNGEMRRTMMNGYCTTCCLLFAVCCLLFAMVEVITYQIHIFVIFELVGMVRSVSMQ